MGYNYQGEGLVALPLILKEGVQNAKLKPKQRLQMGSAHAFCQPFSNPLFRGPAL